MFFFGRQCMILIPAIQEIWADTSDSEESRRARSCRTICRDFRQPSARKKLRLTILTCVRLEYMFNMARSSKSIVKLLEGIWNRILSILYVNQTGMEWQIYASLQTRTDTFSGITSSIKSSLFNKKNVKVSFFPRPRPSQMYAWHSLQHRNAAMPSGALPCGCRKL